MKRWACIARFGGVGDNLVTASVLRPLKRLGYMTEIITSNHAHVVYFNNPFMDKLTVKPDGSIPGGSEWQKWFAKRADEYDVFINLSHSMEVRHALFPDATAFWWPIEYRRKYCAGSYLETVHDIAGVAHEFGPLFFPTEEERVRAEQTKEKIGDQYLVWILSGSRIDKVYPWAPLAIARVIAELHIPVLMMGDGGKQFQYAEQTLDHVRRVNGTADGLHLALSPENAEPGGDTHWPIRRSLTQAITADLVVTPDTGPAWACAFEAMPKIALLSHASPENITKHWINTTTLHADPNAVPCYPCHRLHSSPDTCCPTKEKDVQAAACMTNIKVETVLENIERLWRRNNIVPLHEAA